MLKMLLYHRYIVLTKVLWKFSFGCLHKGEREKNATKICKVISVPNFNTHASEFPYEHHELSEALQGQPKSRLQEIVKC